ncbi:MAG: FeoB-associated Cys-rich membrane protein [Clostridia bacterium]|nr:FeoB-associated Cys-rich membrane protein [Clostridia bacterium]
MDTADYIVLGIIVIILVAIIIYLVRQKKKGVKCIGCPYGGKCSSCNGGCSENNKTD